MSASEVKEWLENVAELSNADFKRKLHLYLDAHEKLRAEADALAVALERIADEYGDSPAFARKALAQYRGTGSAGGGE